MRKRYLANGEKEEPFLESLLHPEGCLLAQLGGGAIFINRPILPAGGSGSVSAKPVLFDQVIPVKDGWRLFKLAKAGQECLPADAITAEEKEALKQLSFLQPAFISITEEQDFNQQYRTFLGKDNNYVLIRPDQYVFAMFEDVNQITAATAEIKSLLCAL
jgi:hypothetical protein